MKHKHAELMKLYAEDAMETDKPWERWEVAESGFHWGPMCTHPLWDQGTKYRRKPDQAQADIEAFNEWWIDNTVNRVKYNTYPSDAWFAALEWERSRQK